MFSAAIGALGKQGVEFEQLARRVMPELMGEAPMEVLEVLMGNSAYRNPSDFVQGLSKFFPAGVVVTCVIIEKQAAGSVPDAKEIPEVARFEAFASKMKTFEAETEGRKLAMLHDHRTEDELDKLAGHRTT